MQFPFKATIFFILLCCLIQSNEAHATKPYIFTAVLDHDTVTIVVEKVIREAYRRLGRTIQIKYYPGLMLKSKRVDLVIDYTLDNNKPIFPLKMNTQFADIKIVEPILDYIYVYHYIHKDNFLIRSQLEKTLSQMIKEGYVKRVQEEVLKNLH